ncbi:hypothetical protein ACFSZS_27665 [Seohaeicola zhoushanensis]
MAWRAFEAVADPATVMEQVFATLLRRQPALAATAAA